MRRRWYLVVVVIAAFAALGWTLTDNGGTFYTKTVLWFTSNSKPVLLPDNGSQTSDVIAFAGTVATQINNGRAPTRYASADAPFYGAGVREGILVALRDTGGQWSSWYSTAVIELQIVGRSKEWVASQRDDIVGRIRATVDEHSGSSSPLNTITIAVEPLTTEVFQVAPSLIQRLSAYAALGLAAVLVSGWSASVLDRLLGLRARARVEANVLETNWEGVRA